MANRNKIDEVAATLDRETNDTPAAASIKAKPTEASSKLGVMTALLNKVGGMPYQDLSKWYDQMMATIGHEADQVPSSADANRSTLNMKPSAAEGKGPWKEEVEAEIAQLFGGEEITEEFKEKATLLFETALEARVILETARIEEEKQAELDEALEEISGELIKNVDEYIGYVAEQWIEENAVAIDSTLRVELMDEFVQGLKNLFTEHYIDIPESKLDVVQELSNKVEELEVRLNDSIEENLTLKGDLKDYHKQEILKQVAEGLVLTQSEKLKQLAEGIEYDGNNETYTRKLEVVRDQYFKPTVKANTQLNEASEVDPTGSETKTANPLMRKYVAAISRTNPR